MKVRACALLLAGLLAWPVRGGDVPTFTLKQLDGSTFRLGDHLGKRVVVAVFWATWCEPCHALLLKLQRLKNRYPEAVVLAISIDDGRSMAAVHQYVQGRGLNLTVLQDADTNVLRMFHASVGVPYTTVIGKDGRIAYRRMGYLPGDEVALGQKVGELLGEGSRKGH